ncbi:MAG: D-amino acid dehydrogenase [Nevskiales bacterium]|nr:D-amino acid dehydrogenase [Nevskiales bacterium]
MRVIVIGSGLQGVTSAWFLARNGCQVTVLDREDGVAQGTSYANAGMLTPSMADPWNAPGVFRRLLHYLGREDAPLLLRPGALPSLLGWGISFLANARPEKFRANMTSNLQLALYSLKVLRELRAALGLSYDQKTAGTLKIFRDTRAFDEAAQRSEILAGLGLHVKALNPGELVAFEPALADVRDTLVGGLHCPDDESGDARLFTEALAGHARQAGVEFRFNTSVLSLDCTGNRVTDVAIYNEKLQADAVVVAAGSWSPQLLKPFGIHLPVCPVKGYSITVPAGMWPTLPQRPVIDDALHAAVTPLGQRLRIAGTAEFAGYDLRLSPARVENLFTLLLDVFPSFKPHLDRSQATPWAGLRPMTPTGVPLVGRLKIENLYVNTGHGHLGWTLAAGSASHLASLVHGERPPIDPTPYRADQY